MISVLFITLLFHSNCMQYIPFQTKTKLPSEKGHFYIKVSDYSHPNYIYINLNQTNIILDSLEYCDSDNVPSDDINCTFKVISPYKSETDNNVVRDIYRFEKYNEHHSFVVFHYNGEKKSDFLIEVECSDGDDNKLETWIIVLIVIASIVFLGIIIGIAIFTIKYLTKKKTIIGQIVPDSNQPSVIVSDTNELDKPLIK